MHQVPNTISAGLSLRLSLTLPAYPASEWSAVLVMRGPGPIDIEADADGDQHVFAATAEQTTSWAPGRYQYQVRVGDGTDVFAAECGFIDVTADLALLPEDTDTRTHARRMLDAIEAVLENRATLEQQRYSIGTRELWRVPVGDLRKLRDHYRDEVRRQDAAARGRSSLLGRAVKVRLR